MCIFIYIVQGFYTICLLVNAQMQIIQVLAFSDWALNKQNNILTLIPLVISCCRLLFPHPTGGSLKYRKNYYIK